MQTPKWLQTVKSILTVKGFLAKNSRNKYKNSYPNTIHNTHEDDKQTGRNRDFENTELSYVWPEAKPVSTSTSSTEKLDNTQILKLVSKDAHSFNNFLNCVQTEYFIDDVERYRNVITFDSNLKIFVALYTHLNTGQS